jgi:hypothetical protein
MISLTMDDIAGLKRIAYSGSHPPRIAKHAQIILKRADGMIKIAVSRNLNIDKKTVSLWE